MKNKAISRILMTAALVIAYGLLASSAAIAQSESPESGASGSARADSHRCSDRTLHGDYGFALEGELLGPNLKFRGVVMQHYDGKGNLSQVDHVVVNGLPPAEEWTPGTGTYTVNSNCTGSAVLNVAGNPPVNLHFVVVKQGKEIHQVVDANAVSAVGVKVD
jgi:hypothetical protein